MTSHELRYCRFLIQTIKDLYVERAAMSTILDRHKAGRVSLDWRSNTKSMSKEAVFRSAVEANFEPFFTKLGLAMRNEQALTALVQAFGTKTMISSSEEIAT